MRMIVLSVSARLGLTVAGLAAATVTAAGCGSSGGTTASQSAAPSSAATSGPASPATTPGASTPGAGPSSGSSAGSGLAACRTSALSVSLDSDQGGGAAGSTYLPIDFTNTSGARCALYGYPGVSFVTGPGGTQIGAAATRASGASSVSVTLAAHATAHAWLQVVEAGNYPASTCQPVTAHWLKVYPPGSTAPSYIGHSFPACSSGKATALTVMPVRSGAGVQGQVP
jgi:Protein of unknown function (DUF4232)